VEDSGRKYIQARKGQRGRIDRCNNEAAGSFRKTNREIAGMQKQKEYIPRMMRSVRQTEPGGKLVVESLPVPEPGPGEVLVKMSVAPINPSDLANLSGSYLTRSWPFTPGIEGSGTIVGSGSGLLPGMRRGKRVACSPDPGKEGTWAEYMKTSVMRTVPLPSGISMEQGSMLLVNPMTAMAFIEMARAGRHRALVNNAAASSLGKMLIRLTQRYSIQLISIVRREEQVRELRDLGAAHVLNSTGESFEEDLKKLAHQLNASLFLDAVNGEETLRLLRAAPRGATLVAYARLSGRPIMADPSDLIREEKKIIGFQLGNWLASTGTLSKFRMINRVKKQLATTLYTHIHKTFPLEEVNSAIDLYRKQMSKGKILLLHGLNQNR
jgi:NADPH2:quinone reductase